MVLGTRLVILAKCDRGEKGYMVHDPARGWVQLTRAELEMNWDGQILEVEATQDLHGASRPAYAFLDRLRNHRGVLWNLVVLSFLSFTLRAIVPWLSGIVLDRVIGLKDASGLFWPIGGMIMIALLGFAVKVSSKYIQGQFGMRFEEELSTAFYRHAVALPVNRFSSRRTGDVITRIQATSSIQAFFSDSPLEALMGLFGSVLCIGLLAFYSVAISLGLFVACAGLLIYHFRAQKKLVVELKAGMALDARSQSLVGEQFASITAIKASGSEIDMRLKWEHVFLERVRLNLASNYRYTPQCVNAFMVTCIVEVGAVWAAGWLAFQNAGTIGGAVTITMLTALALSPVRQLWNLIVDCAQFQVAIGSLEELMCEPLAQPAADNALKHPINLLGKIKLEKVSFRYGSDSPWVLRDLNLTVYPKQMIAIVGVSGSGKTTLARTIAGDLVPSSGRIFYDDFDLNFLSLTDLRSQIGIVTQGNELFQGTIGENVAYADDVPNSEAIERSLELAQARAFVSAKPEGSQRILSEGGGGLSGGERQRLSIARTLYRAPKILILDESTAALDAASEKALIEGLEHTLRERTVIVIAHRLSVIRRADRIVVLSNGEIIEEGTHIELAARKGAYSAMFQKQFQLEGV